MARDYSFSISPSFTEHYNKSLGMYVPNRKIMDDAFKVASEQATLNTGVEHHFVPKDPYDHEAFGITQEHIEENKEHYSKAIESGSLTPKDLA